MELKSTISVLEQLCVGLESQKAQLTLNHKEAVANEWNQAMAIYNEQLFVLKNSISNLHQTIARQKAYLERIEVPSGASFKSLGEW